MNYLTLEKLYYKNPNSYENEYAARFGAPFTQHLDFQIRQTGWPTAYPAFYCYTDEVVGFLVRIYKSTQRVDELVRQTPSVALAQLKNLSMREDIYSTNNIEGVSSSRQEIQTAIENQQKEYSKKRFYSVVNKYAMLGNKGEIPFQSCEDLRNFYDSLLRDEICLDNPHKLPDGTLFRKNGVSVISNGARVLHEGIVPEEKIISTMSYALGVLNDTTVPALIRIALYHYLFGYIHPFYDGNGRTSRFISAYYLGHELHELIGLRFSIAVKKRLKDYYHAFEQTASDRNRGDLTPFVLVFLDIVLDAAQGLEKHLRGKLAQLTQYHGALLKYLSQKKLDGDETLHQLCYILIQAAMFSRAGAMIGQLVQALGKSRNTVDTKLNKLPPECLVKDKRGRQYYYKFNVLTLRPRL